MIRRYVDRHGTTGADQICIDVADSIQYTIYGYAGDDVLIAQGWNDMGSTLYGGGGDDFLQGGNTPYGYNRLDGGAGADTMVGGVGGDEFYVGNRGDVVRDSTSGDDDYVYSAVRFFELPENVEHLFMDWESTRENLSAKGNSLANEMHGLSDDANRLVGLAGNDTLIGGYGGVGHADTLIGGLGADDLEGSPDAIFRYNKSIESDTTHGVDRITVQTNGARARIDLFNVDANAATAGVNDSFVFIGTDAFGTNATGQVRYEMLSSDEATIYISTDADAEAEMEIIFVWLWASMPTLSADNFIL